MQMHTTKNTLLGRQQMRHHRAARAAAAERLPPVAYRMQTKHRTMPASQTFQQQQTKQHIFHTKTVENYSRCLVHNPQHRSSVFATAGETGLALISIMAQTADTALLMPCYNTFDSPTPAAVANCITHKHPCVQRAEACYATMPGCNQRLRQKLLYGAMQEE
jgi:hypothetical protein